MYNCFSLGQFSLFFPPRTFPHVRPTYIHTYVLFGSRTAEIYQAKKKFLVYFFFFLLAGGVVRCGAMLHALLLLLRVVHIGV